MGAPTLPPAMAQVRETDPDAVRAALDDAGARFEPTEGDERWRARLGGSVVVGHDDGILVDGNLARIDALVGDGGSGTARVRFDGASRGNPGEGAAAYVITDDGGVVAEDAETLGEVTNNEAEYLALIAGLRRVDALGFTDVEAVGDSELVVKQVTGEYGVNAENLRPLHEEVTALADGFDGFAIRHVPREVNERADALANDALDEACDGDDGTEEA